MNWHVTQRDSAYLVQLNGRFDAHTAPAVRSWLTQVTEAPQPQIVVDLGGVHFVDSSALGALAAGLQQCRSRGGRLVLTRLTQPVRIIFELTGLDQIFTITATEAEALAALNGRSAGAGK